MAEVDLHTAEAIKCYEFDNVVQFGDLYLTASGVDDNSPSMVENLSWTYNSTNPNNMDLTFTMPMLTNNGKQVLGDDIQPAAGDMVAAEFTPSSPQHSPGWAWLSTRLARSLTYRHKRIKISDILGYSAK